MKRSAIVQARVRPEIKYAAEQVLKGIGLSMTELMELTLRRLIVDRKLPFEVVALSDEKLTTVRRNWERQNIKGTREIHRRSSQHRG